MRKWYQPLQQEAPLGVIVETQAGKTVTHLFVPEPMDATTLDNIAIALEEHAINGTTHHDPVLDDYLEFIESL